MTSKAELNGLTHIREHFHERGELFGIRFKSGIVFLSVDGVEEVKYEPYDSVVYDRQEGAEIPAGEYANFQRLEHDGDDILNINSQSAEKVTHASIGQYPSELRRYTNYPESGNRLRQIEDLTSPRPSQGSDYGYVDGDDSPREFPSITSELVIPPNVNLDFAFHNPTGKPLKPILNITTAQYEVEVLDPREHTDTVKRIVTPGSPMPIYDAGSRSDQVRFDLNWDVEPVSKEEVRRL